MFDELSAKFEDAVKGLRGESKISETNIDLALKDVEKELDVKQFIKRQQEIEKVFVHVKEGFPPFCLN